MKLFFIFTASASSFFPTVYPDKDSNTPASGKTSDVARGRTRPRTLQLDQDDKKNTPTDTTQRKPQTRTSLGGNRRATPTGPPTSKTGDSKNKISRVSAPNLHKLESVQEPRRSSTGTNLSKSKSGSMNSLNAQKENKTSKDSHRPRSKWSSKMASFASVPNLLVTDDDEEFTAPPSNIEKSSSLSRSNPDLLEDIDGKDNNKTVKNPKANISEPSSPYKRRSVQPEKRSASTSRVSGGTAKALAEEKKTVFRKVGASVSSVKGGKDRDLMPPPAITNVAKTKPETKFVKRAQQARRKTTSDISLEEAKDILKGNSGILNGDNGKRRNSGVGSPTNVAPEVRPRSVNDKEDIDMITDPKILDVASEIEKTAAEIRRQSGPQSQYSNLAVSPFEPPEHDTSPERDIPNRHHDSVKYSANTSRSSTHINVEIEPVTKGNTSISDNSLSRSPVSNSNEEDDYPSPSVKERIAKLNKKVSDVDQKNDTSPYNDRLGSQSPVLDMRRASSPRITSSTQFSFSQSRADLTSSQPFTFTPTSLPIVTMATSSVTVTTTSSGSAPSRLSVSKSGQQIAPIPFDPGNDIRQSEQDYVRPIGVSTTSATGKGASSYSVDSLGSQDSETLAPHLSPGSYHSPQSGTDTGLGSDMDTDCSNR